MASDGTGIERCRGKAELGAYNKGATAYRSGVPLEACPYTTVGRNHSSRFFHAWCAGWSDAEWFKQRANDKLTGGDTSGKG